MSVADSVGTFLSIIWGIFSLRVPGFLFDFGDLFVGSMVISYSIRVVHSILGGD